MKCTDVKTVFINIPVKKQWYRPSCRNRIINVLAYTRIRVLISSYLAICILIFSLKKYPTIAFRKKSTWATIWFFSKWYFFYFFFTKKYLHIKLGIIISHKKHFWNKCLTHIYSFDTSIYHRNTVIMIQTNNYLLSPCCDSE